MKLTVCSTSMFDFDAIGNPDCGLVFNVEQCYSDSKGFWYLAECKEPHIVVSYKNESDFNKELNSEICDIYLCYNNFDDDKLTQGAIELRDFARRCFTEFKK